MNELREALLLYLAKLRKEHDRLIVREEADIEDARVNHTSMAESSWKERIRAERRIRAAVGILEALS